MSENALSQKASSKKGLTQKAESQRGMTQKAPSQKGMAQKTPSQKGISQKTESQNVMTQKGMTQKTPSQKGISQKTESQNVMTQKAPSQKGISQMTESQIVMTQNVESQKGMAQNGVAQNTLSKNTISQKSVSQKSKSKHEKVDKTKSRSDEKPCGATVICDATDEAMEYAEKKARMRANVPGQSTYEPWLRLYHGHRKAVEEAKPLIDCYEPMVDRDNYCKIKKYNLRGDAFLKLERENAIIVRRIAEIFVTGSLIDDRHDPNIPTIHRMDNRHERERERKAMRLMHDNVKLYESIQNVKPTICRDSQLAWYGKMEKYMDLRSMWPLHFKPQPCPEAYRVMMGKNATNPKQYAYLQVEMEDNVSTNIICELFAKLCPFTAKNFQKLCMYRKGECDCRSYRCKTIDKLVSIPRRNGEYDRAYWQVGGSVEAMPEFMSNMLKEGSNIKHTKEGYLTKPRGVASGEFYITAGPAPYLDDICFVFGKVTGPGMDFLKQMGETNIDTQGNPKTILHITDCGVAGSPEKVPPSMLMRDFILRVQDDVIPILDGVDSSDEEDDEDEDGDEDV